MGKPGPANEGFGDLKSRGPTPLVAMAAALFQAWHDHAKVRNTLPKSVHGATFDKLAPAERAFGFKQARAGLETLRTLPADVAGVVAEHHDMRPAQVQAVWETVIDEILQRG